MGLDVGELFERYYGAVYRRCLELLRHPDDAADSVQEVFLAAHAGLGRFRLQAAPLTWLYAIATRHCLKKLREKKSHALKAILLVEDAAHEPRFEERSDLEQALRSLELWELELVTLAFRDRLSQEEIAEITRQSRKTVGKKLQELSAKLRLQLAAPPKSVNAEEAARAIAG